MQFNCIILFQLLLYCSAFIPCTISRYWWSVYRKHLYVASHLWCTDSLWIAKMPSVLLLN